MPVSHKTFCARKTLRPTRRDLVIVRVVIVCCSHKIIINNYYGGGNLRACTMHIDVKMHTLYGTWCVRVNNGYDEVNHGWRDDDDLPTQYAAQYIALVVSVVVSLIEHFIFEFCVCSFFVSPSADLMAVCVNHGCTQKPIYKRARANANAMRCLIRT